MPPTARLLWTLAGIGVAAGFFSALFGVGGGLIIVPLLVLGAGFSARAAIATSLAVIGVIALFGVAFFSALGEVAWPEAAMVGLPAIAGAFAGTWLQQRISSRLLVFAFAGLLVAVAVRLLV